MKLTLTSKRTLLILSSMTLAAAGVVAMAQTSTPPPRDPPPAPPKDPATRPPQTPPPSAGRPTIRPPNTDALSATVPDDAVRIYKDSGFDDDAVAVDGVSRSTAATLQELPTNLDGSLSAVRWNLYPGVIAVFYEDAAGKGETFNIFGAGETRSMAKFDFGDKASRWAWFNVGGANVPSHLKTAPLNPPLGVESLAGSVAENTIVFFKDKNFTGTSAEASSINATPHGGLQGLPATLPDSLTSLRWNLGPGIVVMLFQHSDGTKQQLAIWGKGQISDLDKFDFNDKVSRWAWFNIGSTTPPATTTPPPGTTPRPAPGSGTNPPAPGSGGR